MFAKKKLDAEAKSDARADQKLIFFLSGLIIIILIQISASLVHYPNTVSRAVGARTLAYFYSPISIFHT